MLDPFYMDRLNRNDRKKIKRLFVQVVAFYLSLALLFGVAAVIKANYLQSKEGASQQQTAISK